MGVTEKLHEKGERDMVTAWLGDGRGEEQSRDWAHWSQECERYRGTEMSIVHRF